MVAADQLAFVEPEGIVKSDPATDSAARTTASSKRLLTLLSASLTGLARHAEGAFAPAVDENVGALGPFDDRLIPGPVFNVRRFGAAANDEADDTAAIQSAINEAARTGGSVYFPPSSRAYRISATLSVAGAMHVVGGYPQPTIRQVTENQGAFRVSASNVQITNLRLVGTGSDTHYAVGADAVSARGTRDAFVSEIDLNHLTIEDWMFNGIVLEFVNAPTIRRNVISRISYSGISALSSRNGYISGNRVSDIRGSAHENGNGYGITLSKNYGTEAEAPNTADFIVERNEVSRVLTWEGLDTHGGRSIVFRENTIEDCRYGIVVTTARDDSGYIYAGQSITIADNVVRRTRALTMIGAGIQMGASRADYPADRVSITGNVVDGYGGGDPESSDGGSIVVYITNNLTLMNNTINASVGAGISLLTHVRGFAMIGNRLGGTNGTGVNSRAGILIGGESQTGRIEGNVVTAEGGQGAYGFGISAVGRGAGSSITLGGNTLNAGTAVHDPNGILH